LVRKAKDVIVQARMQDSIMMVMAIMLAIATALLSFFSVGFGYVGIGSGLCSLIGILLIDLLFFI
jgi:hypothetical protein